MICFTKYEPVNVPGWGQYAIPAGFANLPQIVQHRILGYLRVHRGRKGLRVQIKAAFRADRRERWGIMTAILLKRVKIIAEIGRIKRVCHHLQNHLRDIKLAGFGIGPLLDKEERDSPK